MSCVTLIRRLEFRLLWAIMADRFDQTFLNHSSHAHLAGNLFCASLIFATPVADMHLAPVLEKSQFQNIDHLARTLSSCALAVYAWKNHKDDNHLVIQVELAIAPEEMALSEFTTLSGLTPFIESYARAHEAYLAVKNHPNSRVKQFADTLADILTFSKQLIRRYRDVIL